MYNLFSSSLSLNAISFFECREYVNISSITALAHSAIIRPMDVLQGSSSRFFHGAAVIKNKKYDEEKKTNKNYLEEAHGLVSNVIP